MVDLVCTHPFKVQFGLLDLGALSGGYGIVQFHDICSLPTL